MISQVDIYIYIYNIYIYTIYIYIQQQCMYMHVLWVDTSISLQVILQASETTQVV